MSMPTKVVKRLAHWQSAVRRRSNKTANKLRGHYQRLTAPIRLLPDFIIIGAQKSGTSSLFAYLTQHPNLSPSLIKEVHYFDHNFYEGNDWYRTHFPSSLYRSFARRVLRREIAIYEASPSYLAHPHVPQRVYDMIPNIKLIALLRNPADRAYSHYHDRLRKNRETLSFEEAIRMDKRILSEYKGQENGDNYKLDEVHYSYLSRGIYVDQLKTWMKVFPQEQFLILKSEDFFADPATTVNRVLKYLGLPSWELRTHKKHNTGSYPKMSAETRKDLAEYFAPHNERLYEYLGMDLGWDT